MSRKILMMSGFIVAALFAASCEDVIDFETQGSGNSQLVVDAWITDQPGQTQSITLSITQPYFDKSPAKKALNATVFVANEDSVVYRFTDTDNDGKYTWQAPTAKDKILEVGKRYALYVAYEGEEYVALSETKRVPKIDSMIYTVEEFPFAPNDSTPRTGFTSEFYAQDFEGEGDTYWIKSYKNDTIRNKPGQITVSYDGAFSAGTNRDGGTFIFPIRQSITDFPTLFQDKDRIKVELYSITTEAYYFLNLVRTVSTNGGLFAVPTSNLPSNVVNRKDGGKQPLGFFCTSAVSTSEITLDKTKAKPKK